MTDDEIKSYADELWFKMVDALDRGLPIARYEVERLQERLAPILEQMVSGTVH